tara:strand:+ start:3367 stop:3963 length:597 start_codon:yes stop_codon:yes gene_type:complete
MSTTFTIPFEGQEISDALSTVVNAESSPNSNGVSTNMVTSGGLYNYLQQLQVSNFDSASVDTGSGLTDTDHKFASSKAIRTYIASALSNFSPATTYVGSINTYVDQDKSGTAATDLFITVSGKVNSSSQSNKQRIGYAEIKIGGNQVAFAEGSNYTQGGAFVCAFVKKGDTYEALIGEGGADANDNGLISIRTLNFTP